MSKGKQVLPMLPLLLAATVITPMSTAHAGNGEALFMGRCAMCHGADIKGTGPLARKSDPPTPDLTTPACASSEGRRDDRRPSASEPHEYRHSGLMMTSFSRPPRRT